MLPQSPQLSPIKIRSTRRLRKGVIDPSYVHFDEGADIYLIQDYPGLIETLRQSLVNVSGTHA